MKCPFCTSERDDIFGLSLHVEMLHPELQHSVKLFADLPGVPIVEIDIDAIHRKWPRQQSAQPATTEHEGAECD